MVNEKRDYCGFSSIFSFFFNPHELSKIILQKFYKVLKCAIWPSTLYPSFSRLILGKLRFTSEEAVARILDSVTLRKDFLML